MFQSVKNKHLKAYLEHEYDIDIIKKYGAYLLVKDGIIVDFFYTLQAAHEFLEGHSNFKEILEANEIPEKLLKKWEKKQTALSPEERLEKEKADKNEDED